MSEENTDKLTDREVLNLILKELYEVKSRLFLIDDRTADIQNGLSTAKIEIAQLRADLTDVKTSVRRIDSVFTQFSRELMDVKAAQGDLDRRILPLENPQ